MGDTIKWTTDQQRAIDFPADCSACVTAAAGSGKTALLIQRVVSLIKGSDSQEPISADKLAILTFTRNAAEEFRTRMTVAIDKASRSGTIPREQLIKFRSSVITTINSFCLGILKEHTELFDLPVNFAIMDDSKREIMLKKALDKTMEYFYGDSFVTDFPEMYRNFLDSGKEHDYSDDEIYELGKNAREQLYKSFSFSGDKSLREAVYNIYLKTTSFANSDEWLMSAAKAYSSVSNMEERFFPTIIEWLRNEFRKLLSDLMQEEELCSRITQITDNTAIHDVFRKCLENDKNTVLGMVNSFNTLFPEDGQEPQEADLQQADISEIDIKATPLDKMQQLFQILMRQEFKRFVGDTSLKDDLLYQDNKKLIMDIRDCMKKRRLEIIEMCSPLREDVEKQLPIQHMAVSALVMLVQQLTMNYSDMKVSAGLVDFSDCEIKLYDKLCEENSPLRNELSERYRCIIVDEFQDTNDLQYEIFRLISRNEKNLFFVGDIKQSIYAFRGGNPKIMAGCCENSKVYEKLPLNRNFRSRAEVISTVNSMFNGVMTKRCGDVEYSDGNALALGAEFPPQKQRDTEYYSELHLLDFDGEDESLTACEEQTAEKSADLESKSDNSNTDSGDDKYKQKDSNAVCEARYTAQLINQMVNEKFMVKKDKENLRPCTWSDFAILMRSKTHFSEFKAELEKLGIPVVSNGGSYLSADETNLILNYLKVIDNPQLDEELLSVLMSPLYGFSAEELALARLCILGYDLNEPKISGIDLSPLFDSYSGRSLFSCISSAALEEESGLSGDDSANTSEDNIKAENDSSEKQEQDTEENPNADNGSEEKKYSYEQVLRLLKDAGLKRKANSKCRQFMEHFKEFQRYASNNSIERLIRRIYDDTDFLSVISTYERGEKKLANIRLLLKYTADFESGGGGTLNDFLRYTDAVRSDSTKLEEAVVPQEAEDAVQLLSFHASKGLQWKIVILAGLGTQMPNDKRSNIIIDRQTGIGLKYTDLKTRIRTNTIGYYGALTSSEASQIGDELRLLYVAMTRAEEKLIMIGQMTKKSADSCCVGKYTQEFVLSGSNFMKWILSSMLSHRADLSSCEIQQVMQLDEPQLTIKRVVGRLPDPDDIAQEQEAQEILYDEQVEKLSVEEKQTADNTAKYISDVLNTDYSYQYETTLQSRFSVTEVAHRNEEKEKAPWDIILPKPSFMAASREGDFHISGALIGNTYHHIMELIRLEKLCTLTQEEIYDRVDSEIRFLADEELLTREECDVDKSMHDILVSNVSEFFCGKLGQEMLHAERVEREYEVFAELPSREALNDNSAPKDSTTIVQGRVDMLYIKDGRLVVVDYKSDSAEGLDKEMKSYTEQLRLYKRILPIFLKDFGKIEMYLYSFGRQKAIDVEEQSKNSNNNIE